MPIPADYGIHDTYVRDGLAFVFAWNTGVIIYDVGKRHPGWLGLGAGRGEPAGHRTTASGSPAVHNGWWFHNPVTEEAALPVHRSGRPRHRRRERQRRHPRGGRLRPDGAPRGGHLLTSTGAGDPQLLDGRVPQVLYAAYYNGGVVALDVSGTLSGDLSDRPHRPVRAGRRRTTPTPGACMLANGSLYASDMISGLWQLEVETTRCRLS